MIKPLFIFLLFISSFCRAQTDDFTAKFKADSIGENGFRKKAFVFDSIKKVWLFGDMNLKNWKKDKVLVLLGRPNEIDTFKKYNMVYFRYNISGQYYRVSIGFKHNRVINIVSENAIVEPMGFTCGGNGGQSLNKPLRATAIRLKGLIRIIAKVAGKDTVRTSVIDTVFVKKYSLEKFIIDHMNYPEVEREAQISGIVEVQFVVERDGSVTNVKIVKGVSGGPDINKEVLRVMTSLSKLAPRKYKGYPVASTYQLGIEFLLQ